MHEHYLKLLLMQAILIFLVMALVGHLKVLCYVLCNFKGADFSRNHQKLDEIAQEKAYQAFIRCVKDHQKLIGYVFRCSKAHIYRLVFPATWTEYYTECFISKSWWCFSSSVQYFPDFPLEHSHRRRSYCYFWGMEILKTVLKSRSDIVDSTLNFKQCDF